MTWLFLMLLGVYLILISSEQRVIHVESDKVAYLMISDFCDNEYKTCHKQ